MAKIKPEYRSSSNRIPYVKFGSGEKTMLIWFGGPGNLLPEGMTFGIQAKPFYPLCEEYSCYICMRKIGLSEDASTESMATDYAEMIKSDFGGKVDAIIGYSYGGLIAQHFAADYPDLCHKIVILSATNENKPVGLEIDEKFTELLIEGKKGKAFALMMNVIMNAGVLRIITKGIMRCFGRFIPLPNYPEFSSDLQIEFEAEKTHDASAKFEKIDFPVLILLGEKDFYFSLESGVKMARKMHNSIFISLKDGTHDSPNHPDFMKNLRKYLEN